MRNFEEKPLVSERIRRNISREGLADTVLDCLDLKIRVKDALSGEYLYMNRRAQPSAEAAAAAVRKRIRIGPGREGPYDLSELLQVLSPEDALDLKERFGGVVEYYDRKLQRWFRSNSITLPWNDREIHVESDLDITQEKESEFRLEYLAWYDDLLGLPNRDKFMLDLGDILRGDNPQGAVLLTDLDEFKDINDAFGHDYGDLLLQAMAYYLSAIPELANAVYRFGGDEMIFLLNGMGKRDVERIVKRLIARYREPWIIRGRSEYCTISAGIVKYPDDGDSPTELLRNVDIAMNRAKQRGRNRYAWYLSDIESTAIRSRMEMDRRMRQAVSDGCSEFIAFYQPIAGLDTKRWIGAEALVRWNDPVKGLVAPDAFIPLSEYNGMIVPIGTHLLNVACAQCKEWQQLVDENFYISVNLSIRQINSPDLVERVEEALERAQLSPCSLMLEVTETMAVQDIDLMIERLEKLRELGVRMALDDFGTGYSSLNNLRKLPLDVVKIDREFTADVLTDSYHRLFIHLVVELAKSIGLSVCTEGIESLSQLGIIQSLGSTYGQGYLFSRPLPPHDFYDLLISQDN